MFHFSCLIIGGGMAAAAAFEGMGEVEGDKGIALISREVQKPYDRPPLSKQLWKADKKFDTGVIYYLKGKRVRGVLL